MPSIIHLFIISFLLSILHIITQQPFPHIYAGDNNDDDNDDDEENYFDEVIIEWENFKSS